MFSYAHKTIELSDIETLGDSISKEEYEVLRNSLIEKNILKLKKDQNRNRWKFHFVGIICHKDNLVLIFPKNYTKTYLDSLNQEDVEKEFGLIFRVLWKAQKKLEKDNNEVDIIETDKGNNELSIANSIIKDYIIHGIYNKSEELVSVNSDNEIHWESTISLVQPVFSKKAPIYPSLYSFDSFTQEDYVITQIHKWSVNFCLKKYGDILFDQKPQFDEGVIANLKEIGAKDYLLHCINKELNEVFVDRNTRLLELLKSLIEKTFKKETEEMIFGTTSFHVVWEKVCQQIFNNKKDKYVAGIQNLSKPNWTFYPKEPQARDGMIPDVFCVKNNKYFTIDAKYYMIKDNPPGVQDVVKQFLYEDMYRKIIEATEKERRDALSQAERDDEDEMTRVAQGEEKFYNIFASPMSSSEAESSAKFFKIIGHVKMEHFKVTNFINRKEARKIWIILLNPKKAYKDYIRNKQKGYDNLDSIVTDIKLLDKSKLSN